MVALLQRLMAFCYYRPFAVLGLSALLTLCSLLYAYFFLEFQVDRSNLLQDSDKYYQLSQEFRQEFPASDDVVLVIEGGDDGDRRAFVDDLIERLNQEPAFFQDVFGRVELSMIRSHGLFFFDLPGLNRLLVELRRNHSLLKALGDESGLEGLMKQFSQNPSRAENLAAMLPFLNQVLDLLLECLKSRGGYQYRSPWESVFFSDVPRDAPDELQSAGKTVIYNRLRGGLLYLVMLRPAPGCDAEVSLGKLRALVARMALSHPKIFCSITGESVLEIDEMKSSMGDAGWATSLSLVLVALLYVLTFREWTRPMMIVLVLTASLIWTLGYATLAIGHLNLLTVTFGTILVGLGVDFGVNFLLRYQEERSRGLLPLPAMQATMQGTGQENLTGALGMSVAFWAIRFMDFKGVAELGDITGAGIMLCFGGMVTMLPAMVFLQERYPARPLRKLGDVRGRMARLEAWWLRHPRIILLISSGLTLIALLKVPEVHFDHNLLNMQAPHLESVRTEMHLIQSSERSVVFGISTPSSLDEAARLTRDFLQRPSVSNVESFLSLLPEDYPEKQPLVQEVELLMEDVPVPKIPTEPPQASSLRGMGEGFQMLEEHFEESYSTLIQASDPRVRREAERFRRILKELFSTLQDMGPGPIMDGLVRFQTDFFSDLQGMISFLKDQRSQPPLRLEDLPESLRSRGLGKTGKILLRIFPKHSPWEREPLERFVKDLQKVDPKVIGTPVMTFYHTESLRHAYEVSGWYAFGVITLLLALHFKNLSDCLLALMPKVVGIIWMLGLMAHYKISFNPANFMTLPLVLGIGLVFGIHILQRFKEENQTAMFACSTGAAIVLDALTNVAGFGALVAAHHRGIASLGFVMTVGTLTNLVTALVVLPCLLQVLYPRGRAVSELPPDGPH